MDVVAELAMNSLQNWMERDKNLIFDYLEELEGACKRLRGKLYQQVSDADADAIVSKASMVREHFLKHRTAYKAIRMIKYHVTEAKKTPAVPTTS